MAARSPRPSRTILVPSKTSLWPAALAGSPVDTVSADPAAVGALFKRDPTSSFGQIAFDV
jgi:hypothetical protein